jgi:hypothetical protein
MSIQKLNKCFRDIPRSSPQKEKCITFEIRPRDISKTFIQFLYRHIFSRYPRPLKKEKEKKRKGGGDSGPSLPLRGRGGRDHGSLPPPCIVGCSRVSRFVVYVGCRNARQKVSFAVKILILFYCNIHIVVLLSPSLSCQVVNFTSVCLSWLMITFS